VTVRDAAAEKVAMELGDSPSTLQRWMQWCLELCEGASGEG
jgi:hypothetical protein